jgi:hypothetical protein
MAKKAAPKRKGYDGGGKVSRTTAPANWRPEDYGKSAQGLFGPMLGTSGPANLRDQTWQQYVKDAEADTGKAKGGKVRKTLPAKKGKR